MNRTIEVAFLRDIDPTRGDRVNPRNRVERSGKLRPEFQACRDSRVTGRGRMSQAHRPQIDHSNTSIDEPGADEHQDRYHQRAYQVYVAAD